MARSGRSLPSGVLGMYIIVLTLVKRQTIGRKCLAHIMVSGTEIEYSVDTLSY